MSRLTINSNIPSLNAQRSLGNATKKLGDSFTRLSSGLRINKSSDDAAGLSISESLKSDTRLFNQGIRNLNDGVSVLSIADGALGELSNIVIRLNELAEQAATGTLGNKQRLALDQEAQSLSKEYNRIARSTEFNGRKIFNGDYGDLSLAAGGGRESLIVEDLGGAVGDGTFSYITSYSTGTGLNSVNTVDVNSDGIIDLISASAGEEGFNVLLGHGDGSFKSKQTYFIGGNSGSSVMGDYNGDGNIDIASVDYSLNYMRISLGNGDGSFKHGTSYRTQNSLHFSLSQGDFNGDGKMDIAVPEYTSGGISIFLNNGDGSFSTSVSYQGAVLPYMVKVGDINNDGNLDLVSADTAAAGIKIHLGNGNGSFKASESFVTNAGIYAVQLSDLNGDGNIDIVSGSSSSLDIIFGNGDGGFNQKISYTANQSYLIDIADFNGDGIKDIISTDQNEDTLSVFMGNSGGSFLARKTIQIGSNLTSSALSDLNSDGVIDIVSTDFVDNTLSVYLGNSTSGVSALQSFSLRTQQDAKDSMSYLRKTLERIGQQRGHIGAFQSRVEFATNNLQTSALSYQEANSRITDIDVAEESSRLAATQILQQSASSILAQANQQPQLVLNLLRDL